MKTIQTPEQCCGCSACANVCPHKAIEMRPDALGFLFPKINQELCVDCGLCERICVMDNVADIDWEKEPQAFSFRLKSIDELAKSQSGGAFYALACNAIHQGAVVYGAAFDTQWSVTHQKVVTIEGLDKLRMSKYVQSDIRGAFDSVKEDLRNGKCVLFSGTPCQVAGVKAAVPKPLRERLITIDIICHGVPAPKIWEDYVSYLEKKHHSAIKKACFRDKRKGWHGAIESFLFANGKEVFRETSNALYFSGFSMRDSCAVCPFASTHREGDITIGDWWAVPKDSKLNDDKGVSMILVNSEKGKALLDVIRDFADMESITLAECKQYNMEHPSTLHFKRKQFVEDYINKGFVYVGKRYADMGWRHIARKYLALIKQMIKE